jgi:modulator of FtsH protease
MGSWQTFFATQAGVGAALTGLVFVALSINLKQILAIPSLANRAGEALLLLLLPVINGLVGVLPQTSTRAVGGELLAVALTLWVVVSLILARARKDGHGRPAHEFAIRVGTAEAAVVPAIVAGCLLLTGNLDGMWWQAAATILCIVAGVSDAWVLLVEILR